MNVGGSDVHQTLEYRTPTAFARMLPVGLLTCFAGLLAFALLDDRRASLLNIVGAGAGVVTGIGLTVYALWRRSHPGRPLFVLSPAGVYYRIPRVKAFLVPWREIRGIDTIEIRAGHSSIRYPGIWVYRTLVYRDVTAIVVSKQFYDAHIFVDSPFRRGPGWKNTFFPKGSLVQMALHHELVSVAPQALRQAIEARWHAFRGETTPASLATPGETPARSATVPRVRSVSTRALAQSDAAASGAQPVAIAVGDDSKAISRWEAALIIVSLVGMVVVLANLLGLWETPGQSKARETRQRYEQIQADSKRLKEEQQDRDRKLQELFRRNF
jgi:hypothetical protein